MKIVGLSREWCERMARQEESAGVTDIEAGGLPVGNSREAALADSTAPKPKQANRHRTHTQKTSRLPRQQLVKV